MRKSVVALAAAACLSASYALAQSADAPSSATVESLVTSTCQNCHGPLGDSNAATFPRLNAQQADYVAAQLTNFRGHNRSDPHARAYMWGMAAQLDDKMIAALAQYYAGQKPTAPQSGGDLAKQGANIFKIGVEAQNIPACQTCHGEHGEGAGAFPRLAGQHADYLRNQLESFRSALRESDVMHVESKDMTDSQIEALISYLGND